MSQEGVDEEAGFEEDGGCPTSCGQPVKPCPKRKKRKVSYTWRPPPASPRPSYSPCPHIYFKNLKAAREKELSRDERIGILSSPTKHPWQKSTLPRPELIRYRKREVTPRNIQLAIPNLQRVQALFEEQKHCGVLEISRLERLERMLQEEFLLPSVQAKKIVKSVKRKKKQKELEICDPCPFIDERVPSTEFSRENFMKGMITEIANHVSDVTEIKQGPTAKRLAEIVTAIMTRFEELADEETTPPDPAQNFGDGKLSQLLVTCAGRMAGWIENVIYEADKAVIENFEAADAENRPPPCEHEILPCGHLPMLPCGHQVIVPCSFHTTACYPPPPREPPPPPPPCLPCDPCCHAPEPPPCQQWVPCYENAPKCGKKKSRKSGKKRHKKKKRKPKDEDDDDEEQCQCTCQCEPSPRKRGKGKGKKGKGKSKDKKGKKGEGGDDEETLVGRQKTEEGEEGGGDGGETEGEETDGEGGDTDAEVEEVGGGGEGEGGEETEEPVPGSKSPSPKSSPGKTPPKTPTSQGSKPSSPSKSPAKSPPPKSPEKSPPKSAERSPPKSAEKSPPKSAEKSPPKSGEKTPAKSGEKSPAKTEEKSPTKSGEKSPAKSGEKSPAKPGEKSPGKSGEKSPGKSGERTPAKSEEKSPAKSPQKSSGGGTPGSKPASGRSTPGKSPKSPGSQAAGAAGGDGGAGDEGMGEGEGAPAEAPAPEEPAPEEPEEAVEAAVEGAVEDAVEAAVEDAVEGDLQISNIGDALVEEAIESALEDEAGETATFNSILEQLSYMIEDIPDKDPDKRRVKLTKTLEMKFTELVAAEGADTAEIDEATKQTIIKVATKIANWMEDVIEEAESRLSVLAADEGAAVALMPPVQRMPSPVTSESVRDWASWIVEAMAVADDWADWISKTVRAAEEKAAKKKGLVVQDDGGVAKLTRTEYSTWKEDVKTGAIDYRMKKRYIAETAYDWKQKTHDRPLKHRANPGEPTTSSAADEQPPPPPAVEEAPPPAEEVAPPPAEEAALPPVEEEASPPAENEAPPPGEEPPPEE